MDDKLPLKTAKFTSLKSLYGKYLKILLRVFKYKYILFQNLFSEQKSIMLILIVLF